MNDWQIFTNIQRHTTLDASEIQRIQSSLHFTNIHKGDLLLRQGDTSRKLFFVESGSLRAFYIDDEGKEATIMFAIKDWWITDMDSFINQSPALMAIEALEDSSIIELKHDQLEQLYLDTPKLERFFRILFQKAYVREQLRALQNISLSTLERYEEFITKYPTITQKVTQKQIASYLGVTPEFLSSVKRKQSDLKLS